MVEKSGRYNLNKVIKVNIHTLKKGTKCHHGLTTVPTQKGTATILWCSCIKCII